MLGQIKSQKLHFQQVHSIFFKTALFFAPFIRVGTLHEASSLTTPGAAASGLPGSKS